MSSHSTHSTHHPTTTITWSDPTHLPNATHLLFIIFIHVSSRGKGCLFLQKLRLQGIIQPINFFEKRCIFSINNWGGNRVIKKLIFIWSFNKQFNLTFIHSCHFFDYFKWASIKWWNNFCHYSAFYQSMGLLVYSVDNW